MLGTWEIVIIGGLVVLLFGTSKLPKLGGAIGESIRNFKKGVKEVDKLESGSENSDKTASGKKQDQSEDAK